MKILVTGARGFVGARIMDEWNEAIPAPSLRGANEDAIRQLLDTVDPDVIIHTAAISDIPACEKNPDASYQANVEIPVWLAKTGVKLVAFSTDQVYSGCNDEGPYREEAAEPANLYARHKLEMERRTLEANPNTVLLRATWMYDMPIYRIANRGNFLVNMLRNKELSFSSTQHRAVTYVREVAYHIMEAASLPGGVYNYGSENEFTMMDTALWLKKTLSLPIMIHDAGLLHNLWMDCSRIKNNGIHFNSTLDGLRECMEDYGLCEISR
ncbi:MAG: sugar nucleotide-binding protein [Blautia sp.]|nr:sugar nucleotide-binding protein [Blautia sp.]